MSESIDEATIAHIARLSRIELDPAEVPRFAKEFSDILSHFDKLAELDTEDVEPLTHAVETHNVMGEDEPRPCLTNEEALAAAPDADGPFFKVPKVLGDS